MNPAILGSVESIACTRGTYRGVLRWNLAGQDARRLIVAWGGTLFRGATFTVVRRSPAWKASTETKTYAEIAAWFGVATRQKAAKRTPEEIAASRLERLRQKYGTETAHGRKAA